ncbi:unnamed protein product, partial [Ixodes pacificus]
SQEPLFLFFSLYVHAGSVLYTRYCACARIGAACHGVESDLFGGAPQQLSRTFLVTWAFRATCDILIAGPELWLIVFPYTKSCINCIEMLGKVNLFLHRVTTEISHNMGTAYAMHQLSGSLTGYSF